MDCSHTIDLCCFVCLLLSILISPPPVIHRGGCFGDLFEYATCGGLAYGPPGFWVVNGCNSRSYANLVQVGCRAVWPASSHLAMFNEALLVYCIWMSFGSMGWLNASS